MDLTLGPTLVNVFPCHYKIIWLNECPPQFKLLIYRRYADNIFVLFYYKKHLKLFVNCMNSKYNIKLTLEAEDMKFLIFKCQK